MDQIIEKPTDPAALLSGWRGCVDRALDFVVFGSKRWAPSTTVRWAVRWGGATTGWTPFVSCGSGGVSLSGMRRPAAADAPRRMPVIVLHGWVEVKEMYLGFGRELASRGHDVLLLDHRGHGLSGGDTFTFGAAEAADVSAVIDHATSAGWIDTPVCVMGHSAGAVVALRAAAADSRVAAVVASAPFSDLAMAVETWRRSRMPVLSAGWLRRVVRRIAECRSVPIDAGEVASVAASLEVPALVIAAGRDRLLPPALHADRVAAALRHPRSRRMEIARAGHFGLLQRHAATLWPHIDRFLSDSERFTRRRQALRRGVRCGGPVPSAARRWTA